MKRPLPAGLVKHVEAMTLWLGLGTFGGSGGART